MKPFSRLIRFESGGEPFFADLSTAKEVPSAGLSIPAYRTYNELLNTQNVVKVHFEKLLAPLPRSDLPVYCVGLNYRSHAKEAKLNIPMNPPVWTKPPAALASAEEDIQMSRYCASNLPDWEGELVFVTSKECRDISVEEAESCILGYTVGNDLSCRFFQLPAQNGGQFFYAKAFDKFAPIGPVLVSPELFNSGDKTKLTTRVNGKVTQNVEIQKDRIFSPAQILSFMSQSTTIPAYTAVMTGTPAGVGAFMKPKQFLRHNDLVEVEVDGIGILRNKITFPDGQDSQLRKIKCNQQRPTCSRCQEAGIACFYSSKRRKPGPPKGVRRKRRSPQAGSDILPDPAQLMNELNSTTFPSQDIDSTFTNIDFLSESGFPGADTFFGLNFSNTGPSVETQPVDASATNIGSQELPFSAADELNLLNNFFTYFHPSGFLFQKDKFFAQYHDGLLDKSLINTILVVTSLTLRPHATTDYINLEDLLDRLRASCSDAIEGSSGFLTLDNFRQACMLTFFDFHQRPGLRSWMKVGQLTRHAYRQGLNQIENSDTCAIYQLPHVLHQDIENWRRVWWFIYTLDSYSNIIASTPFLIEPDGINTALISQDSTTMGLEDLQKSERAFLASEPDQLWKTMRKIVANGNELNANIHLITTTVMRMAAKLSLLRKQNPSETIIRRIESLKEHISAVRLAMPLRYMKLTRDVIFNETKENHHERLVCILHIHAAFLMLSIPPYSHKDEDMWLIAWRQCLEPCDDIVSAIKEWDGSFSSNTDPALCYIVFGTLVTIWLLGKYGFEDDIEVQERMSRASNILTLFLDHFEPLCCQPTVLKERFTKLHVQYPGPIGQKEINQLLQSTNGLFPLSAPDLPIQQDPLRGTASVQMPVGTVEEDGLTASNLLAGNFDIDDLELII